MKTRPDRSEKKTRESADRGLFHTDSPAAKIALLGLLTALAIVMGYVEYRIPLPLPVPGIKLGLCNIVIVFVLYRFGLLRALLVSLIRVVVIGLLFGTPISMLYAAGGAVLSLTGMWLLKKAGRFSVIGISGAGGALHSLGQILVAAVFTGGTGIFRYLPVLLLSGEFCGVLIGLVVTIVLRRLKIRRNESVI